MSRCWRQFCERLPVLENLRVQRWLGTIRSGQSKLELHGFADASEKAYAAVVYVRCCPLGATPRVTLVLAKTRVAPLNRVSLPRLELCAAALLAKVVTHVRELMGLSTSPVHLWSDSTVALGWIRGHPSRWTTFVANRVAEIQRVSPGAVWRHVSGDENPADCATRGLAPQELEGHPLWWRDLACLTDSDTAWSGSIKVEDENLPEQRRNTNVTVVAESDSDLLMRFSSLSRLLRTTAWMLRWRRRLAASPGGPLEAEELSDAERRWISLEQRASYPEETAAIAAGSPLRGRSTLVGLLPFLDKNGLLRCGGRLRHSELEADCCRPVILPPKSLYTKLVVMAVHRRTLHGGVQLTMAVLRRRFWIPRGKRLVRQLLHGCVPCSRWRAASPRPLMAELPKARVTPSRPFTTTGVDFAGPVTLRASRGRGHKAYKGYICVFVCLATRAVHLEAVSDYSADAFLAAFRRFTARRGLCHDMLSDCGTNFVGADRQLRDLFRAAGRESHRITTALAEEGMRWRFNPPSAPHFGGIWEATVRSAKHHLRRVVGDATLTFEEMATLLAEVEACLNSRPLQALTDDPEDLEPLTPGHFLIGAPLLAIPEPLLDQEPMSRLSRWKLLQRMRDHIWKRWSEEYVTSLLPRQKWRTPSRPLEVGQLCLVRSQINSPAQWPLARIVRLHPGADGHVRVVTVRTARGELCRPVVKVVPLPGAASM